MRRNYDTGKLSLVDRIGLGLGAFVITAAGVLGCGNGKEEPKITAQNDSEIIQEDSSNNLIDVLANDSSDNGIMNIESVGLANKGDVSIDGDKVSYTPDANFFGSDSFDYTINNDKVSSTGSVNITVENVNDAPVLDSISDKVVESGNLVSLSPSASDVDGDSLSFSYSSPFDANGEFNATEENIGNYTGLTVSCSDGNGGSDSVSFDMLAHSQLEDTIGKYVIVTSQALAPNFEDLRVWKANKGYDSEIVTIEDIISSESGRDVQEKIREKIKNIKLNNMNKDVYVLLGGDVEVVPHRQVTATCSYNDGLTDTTMPCDLYFSDTFIEGTTTASVWDGNVDNVFARQPEDSPDLHPDVFVGRAPVNTAAEADNFVWKDLGYEQVHDMSNIGQVLFSATILGPGADEIPGNSDDTDAKVAKSWIDGNIYDFSANGFTVTSCYESDGNGDVDTIMSELEIGPHIVNIYTHGSEQTLNFPGGPLNSNGIYPAGDVRTLTNSSSTNRNFIFYSLGCHSNHYDNTTDFPSGDCILEELINNTQGGAVACIGTSRIGLFNGKQPDGSGISWSYDKEFFKSLFTEGIDNLGKAFADSKEEYAELSKTNQDRRWVQLCLNLLGDPELVVWKDNLGTITANVSQGSNYTLVETNTPGARVCLNDGTNVYSTLTNSKGDAILSTSGSLTTTVTKKDYLPYFE